ncbi:MAG: bifunctional 2-C-methyl-D-erythritol 4-phosphate cytidylyltransferase/2-C-methyl-D-erythritol 2,4-cyclodiphosphate synthase [Magnetovibrio sp.]|nr:bifunctional 2-C-methyl-D-erythritol 4-phosphate cytidylyltransferase/2-C-methyl-D-erythritol 2,4-cyclodiphosphate synthase [Magnetovibrio sp.]
MCVAIVLGGGRGNRFGGKVPKQYSDFHGEPLIRKVVKAFTTHPDIDAVLPVIHLEDKEVAFKALENLDALEPVIGGEERQHSVKNALESLTATPPHNVLIHDAARPFISSSLISRVIHSLETEKAVVPGLPVTDTIKSHNGKRIISTLKRDRLLHAQTPQGFRYKNILSAHRNVQGDAYTDDAAVAEASGLKVAFVNGEKKNIKITNPEDLDSNKNKSDIIEYRVGNGFDVHRFGDGNHVVLCGIKIPHNYSLIGHSDADAAMHALTDAILGAIGKGDIGYYFPPSAQKWKNVSSKVFLKYAADLVKKSRGKVTHVDITIVCQQPKIRPHREAMVNNIANILQINASRVNIKATTTETLGFTGRNEGLMAQATATIAMRPNDDDLTD